MSENFVILIVDDNANNRFTLRALLRHLPNAEILEADSGETALMHTIEQAVHLILLDVQMPVMDGFETAHHLQMTERTRYIPIVFVTAVFKSDEFIQRGYSIGAIDYLTKPIDTNLLLNRVKLYQHLYKHRRELEYSITLLQQNEQELLRLKDTAEAANRAKSIFLSKMSHELRTPLNAISGFAQLLELSEQPLTEEQQDCVNEIKAGSEYLITLINELLDVAKIESGKIQLSKQSLNAANVINELIHLLKGICEKNQIAFINRLNFELPPIWADPTRFRQIMLNFLSNAIKYNRYNGCVIISNYLLNQNMMRITVKDTGIGIDSEHLDKVFEAYERGAAETSAIEGTGIGLHVCKQLAELMQGSVHVCSEINVGGCFWVDMPLDKNHIKINPLKTRHNVLYIESEKNNIALMAHLLNQRANCNLFNASDLNSALQLLEIQNMSIILINAYSFKTHYLNFLTTLQNYPAIKNIPIVAIFDRTAEPVEIKKALQAGFYDYISQPFDFNFSMMVFDNLLS
jgi:hypothetical protein